MTAWTRNRIRLYDAFTRPGGGAGFSSNHNDGLGLRHTRRHVGCGAGRSLICAGFVRCCWRTGLMWSAASGLHLRLTFKNCPVCAKSPMRNMPTTIANPRSRNSHARSACSRRQSGVRPAGGIGAQAPVRGQGELRAGLEELRTAGGCCVLGLARYPGLSGHGAQGIGGRRIWERTG